MTVKNENVNYKPMIVVSAMFMGIIGSGFMSKEELPVQNVPSIVQQKENMKLLVDAPVSMAAGDITSINKIVSTIMSDQIPAMATPVLKSSEGLTSIYRLADYEIKLENFDLSKHSEQEIFVSIQKVEQGAVNKPDSLVLTAVSEVGAPQLKSDVVSTYKLKVNVFDSVKPVIEITQDEDTFIEGDEIDTEAYIISATDDIDGEITHETQSDVDSETAGTYTITYSAKDSAGNETSASVSIIVEEKEEEEEEVVVPTSSSSYKNTSGSTSNQSISGGGVLGSALAQIGASQDCTALVTRALAANGIYHHGYPASYLSLGYTVSASEAQPGDILYYANGGAGSAHVAVYAGNGQAVHGGWNGNQTVLGSAYVGSGPVFIRLGR